ncbi:transcriptional regulator [Haloarcula brevis]|uniref:transcriptional regulator n=1 Tax=Haloarcula brevis TaxID=3111453 RepID=UPI00300F0C1F
MENIRQTLSFDDMVDALADVQRRKLLVALLEHNPQDDTPVVIADSESDADAVERLVTMQHVHLPKLVDYGFIEWNEETHEVTKGPKFDEIRPLLELLDDHEDELPADWL